MKAGLMIFGALSPIVERWQRWALFLVEEAFTILFGIAVVFTLTWITLAGFLLLWQGASLVFLQMKRIIPRGPSIGDRPLAIRRQPSQIKEMPKGITATGRAALARQGYNSN